MAAQVEPATTISLPGKPEPQVDTVSLAEEHGIGRGNLRVAGDAVDVSVMREKIVFPVSGKVAPNRFMKAPMTERLSLWPGNHAEDPLSRGVPSEELINLYRRWGEGEIGTIVAGNLMINHTSVESYGNGIFLSNHDNRLEQYKRLAAAAKAHGSLFIAQLSHPGRQGGKHLNPNPVSASDVQLQIKWLGNEFEKPRPLEVDEIKEIVNQFAESAYWCWKAGYDGVQVHCAHGYLLAQFLSRTTNLRTDQFGGPLENRSRIVFEIISAIRQKIPDETFSISVKLNSVEFQDKGTTPEECKDLCLKLEAAGVDFVDISGGTFESRAFVHKKESTKQREAYFIEFAEMIRPLLKKTIVFVTGGFRTASGMVSAVNSGACDGVGIGRPLAAEPFLCKEILEGKVTGALESFMPAALNTQGFGTQIHQIGRGDRVLSDWSAKEEVERWIKANEEDTERRMGILPKIDSAGYPVFKAKHGFRYLD